jgi:hypothetical protein
MNLLVGSLISGAGGFVMVWSTRRPEWAPMGGFVGVLLIFAGFAVAGS